MRKEDPKAGSAHQRGSDGDQTTAADAPGQHGAGGKIADDVGKRDERTEYARGSKRNVHARDEQDRQEAEQRERHQAVEGEKGREQHRPAACQRLGRIRAETAGGGARPALGG
ncbi:hypothetical protein FQZ97_1143980 [compost metagenome]